MADQLSRCCIDRLNRHALPDICFLTEFHMSGFGVNQELAPRRPLFVDLLDSPT